MNTARDYLHQLIDQITEKETYKDLEDASQSSMGFWDNAIDDEVWKLVI